MEIWCRGLGFEERGVLCGRGWDLVGGIVHASENVGDGLGRWLLTYMRVMV